MSGRKNPTPVRRLAALTGVFFLLMLGIALFFWIDPSETRFFPRCPFFVLTGLKCAGCGTTRAFHAMLHGRFVEALGFNAALPALLVLLAYCLIFPRHVQRPIMVWAIVALIAVWWIVRNLIGI